MCSLSVTSGFSLGQRPLPPTLYRWEAGFNPVFPLAGRGSQWAAGRRGSSLQRDEPRVCLARREASRGDMCCLPSRGRVYLKPSVTEGTHGSLFRHTPCLEVMEHSCLSPGGPVLRGAAVLLTRCHIDPPHVQLCGQGPSLLVEEERELAVHQQVVVDGGQAGAQLQLRPLVAQVHGGSQSQLVVACRVEGVLEGQQQHELPRKHVSCCHMEVREHDVPQRLVHPHVVQGLLVKPQRAGTEAQGLQVVVLSQFILVQTVVQGGQTMGLRTQRDADVQSRLSKLHSVLIQLEMQHQFSQLVAQPQPGAQAAALHCDGQSAVLHRDTHHQRGGFLWLYLRLILL
ncbi:hypothetical protein EYF80_057219 [Liparis tanakae]|uniref:Uncharacterized protein n=1 Tax=Liparis tanakae TaxID=230148 RepID=A0A4Z2EUL2_9TELE|nr:hypothetical protein EYF80_057219 [Liparis tanakae]